MNHRPLRVSQLVRDELANILLRDFEFGGALVTVTEVIADKKLMVAKVKISVLPPAKTQRVISLLQKEHGRIQHALNHKLGIRPMPRIDFEVDRGAENAARVEKDLLSRG